VSSSKSLAADGQQRSSLREQVERLLPSWESWYPSLFHAAEDLGLIRARVCAPALLMLSNRHASIQNEALQAFKEQWCVEDEPDAPSPVSSVLRRLGGHAPGRPGAQRDGRSAGQPNNGMHRKPNGRPGR